MKAIVNVFALKMSKCVVELTDGGRCQLGVIV